MGSDELDPGGRDFYDEDDIEALDEEAEWTGRRLVRGGNDDPYVAGGERLQKVLAHAGVASRRACESLIASGRVSVDGMTVTETGLRVDPATQEIRLDGARVLTDPDVVTVMVHKPAGVVTTMEDPQGRPTVAGLADEWVVEHADELNNPARVRLVHVGRLDTETEGLLLVSNDGELSHRLMHPSYEIAKTYVAIVEGRAEHWVPSRLRRGVELGDGIAKADRVIIKDSGPAGSIIEITLHSGRNRVVRRMLAAVGHPVTRLARTRIGPLTLGSLRSGRARRLTGAEVSALQNEVGL